MTLKLPLGTIVSGRYQVGELIGESELSAVHAATDLRGSAVVALKVFDPSVTARAAALSEYQAQARQASGLGVEGIARAYDFGIDANSGAPFSTAERIGWPSLERRVLAEGPLGVVELARAMTVLGRALDAAHATGLVHRDLKPKNVFISPDNPEWARITDFGVGALRRGAPEAMGWGGPPGYTPPEAVDAAAPATPFADHFALGVLAFFALTRGTPFRSLRGAGFEPSAHWAELNQPLSPISERARELGVALDPSLDPWFARALSLGPEQRFPSASEMARELVALSEQLGPRGAGPRSIPGIAVAIAQPLVFQPEPSPASLGLAPAPTTANVTPEGVASAPAFAPSVDASAAPRKKSLALPLMLGAGVLLLSGLALGGYAVLSGRQAPPALSAAPDVTPPAAPVTSAAPPVAVQEPPVVDAAPTPPPASAAAAAASSARREETATGSAPKPAPVTAAKPAPVEAKAAPTATAKVAGTPKPAASAAKPVASAAKPSVTSVTKPAASALAKAPAAAASGASKSTKKKCSAFLGCK